MPRGGKRIGAGRKKGQVKTIDAKMLDAKAIEAAKAQGRLPHELLREWANDLTLTTQERLSAAAAAAPYFAPKKSEIDDKRDDPRSEEELAIAMRASLKAFMLRHPDVIQEIAREIEQEKRASMPPAPPELAVVA